MFLFFVSFIFAQDLKCEPQKKELYVQSDELKRIGEKGVNGIRFHNKMVCNELLRGKYDSKKDVCTIMAEVCYK